MKSILIKDTTREERIRIVHQALWGSCGVDCEFCSGCDNRGGGRIESIYQPYIDGLKEIREINEDYLDGEYKEENVEMMAWKTVKGSYPDTEHVKFRTLPEVTVASCTYQGSYTQITDVYAAVIAWMEANGYEPAEPMFNIYHVSPHETQNPDEFVTEICYPVRKK
jgi:hypothetical protein